MIDSAHAGKQINQIEQYSSDDNNRGGAKGEGEIKTPYFSCRLCAVFRRTEKHHRPAEMLINFIKNKEERKDNKA